LNIYYLGGVVSVVMAFLGFNAFIQQVISWNIVVVIGGLSLLALFMFFFGDKVMEGSDSFGSKIDNLSVSSSRNYEMKLDPMDAPNFVNNRIKKKRDNGIENPGRPLNLDYTDPDNEKVRVKTKPAPRYEKWFSIVLGRPRDQKSTESIAYLVDMSEGRIMDYTGNLHTAEDRDKPFNGQYDYLFKEKYSNVSEKQNDQKEAGQFVTVHADGKGDRT